jgi:hypothetical protein
VELFEREGIEVSKEFPREEQKKIKYLIPSNSKIIVIIVKVEDRIEY